MASSVIAYDEINDIIHDCSKLEVHNAIRLKPNSELEAIFAKQRAEVIVAKPLMESQRAAELLDDFPNSVGLWLLRGYRAVANSMIKKWGTEAGFVQLLPILKGQGTWREENVPDWVVEKVHQHANPEMPHADGCALFWYVRNALFLEQNLGAHPRMAVVQYERLVTEPGYLSKQLRSVGIECGLDPDFYTAGSLHKGREIEISEPIAELCDDLEEKLLKAAKAAESRKPSTIASLRNSPRETIGKPGFWRNLPVFRRVYRERARANELRAKCDELRRQRDEFKRRHEATRQRLEAVRSIVSES